MSQDHRVQLCRDDASFKMTLNTEEESPGVRDKHSKHFISKSESLQTANDREENGIVVIKAHPSPADLYADKQSPDISHVRDGKPKSDSNAIRKTQFL